MAESKIIKELVNEEISLSVALKRIIVLANDIEYIELKQWAEKELNGYNKDDEVPEYRYISSSYFTYNGLVGGRMSVNQATLSLSTLSTETLNEIIKCKITESIASIEDKAKVKNGDFAINRSYLAGEVLKNTGGYLTGIQCTSIEQHFVSAQFKKIVEIVSSKILDILLKLDKEFGNLDDIDIGSEKHLRKKIQDVKHGIQIVINEDNSVNISGKLKKSQINIGNGNKTSIKKERKVNKNANVGKGSNSIEKHTDIDSNVSISNKKEKQPWHFSTIFHKRRK